MAGTSLAACTGGGSPPPGDLGAMPAGESIGTAAARSGPAPAAGSVVASIPPGSPDEACTIDGGHLILASPPAHSPGRIRFHDGTGARRATYSPSAVAGDHQVLSSVPAVDAGRPIVVATTHSDDAARARPAARRAALVLYEADARRVRWRVDAFLGADRSDARVQPAVPVTVVRSVVVALQRRSYGTGVLVGLDRRDGSVLWRLESSDWRPAFERSFDGGHLVILTRSHRQAVVDPGTGRVVVTLEGQSTSRPVQVLPGGVYVGVDGTIPFVAGPDGRTRQTVKTEGPSFALSDDGMLVNSTQSEGLVAWDLATGVRQWSIPRAQLDAEGFRLAAAANGHALGLVSAQLPTRPTAGRFRLLSLEDGSTVGHFDGEGSGVVVGVQQGSHYLTCGHPGQPARSFASAGLPIAVVGDRLIHG